MSEKYEFVDTTLTEPSYPFPVASMCRWLAVSTSGFYAWQGRPESATVRRRGVLKALVCHAPKHSSRSPPRRPGPVPPHDPLHHHPVISPPTTAHQRRRTRRRAGRTRSARWTPASRGRSSNTYAADDKWDADPALPLVERQRPHNRGPPARPVRQLRCGSCTTSLSITLRALALLQPRGRRVRRLR